MKTLLVFCSKYKNTDELRGVYGKYNILESEGLSNVDIIGEYGNRTKLAKRYNNFIENKTDWDIIVFVHDDVQIIDKKWVNKLESAFLKYDIVGLAGGKNANISPMCLWHHMCPRDTWSGSVYHVNDTKDGIFKTHFGKTGRVLILDGLFLAIKTSSIGNTRFDETNPCIAHFYDIDFSLTANKNKLKLGTTNIDVIHNSPGLKQTTDEWLSGQAWFLQKFNEGKY